MTPTERAAYERGREDDGWIRAWNEWTGPCGGPPIHHGTSLDQAIREAFRAGFSAGKARGREDERRDVVVWLRERSAAWLRRAGCAGPEGTVAYTYEEAYDTAADNFEDARHLPAPAETEGEQ